MPGAIRQMKKEPGEDMAILGSGSIVSQLTEHRLIDEYHLVMIPVALGNGRTMFDGIKEKLLLKLTKTRTFGKWECLAVLRAVGVKPLCLHCEEKER